MAKWLMGACLGIALASLAAADEPAAKTIEGPHQIRNHRYAEAELVLRPRDASDAEGNPIVLYRRTTWKCLTWKVNPAGSSGEVLVNHFTNKTFAPASKPAEGAKSVPVVQVTPAQPASADQLWRFVPEGGSSYRIVHAASGWVLSAVKTDDGSFGIVVAPWTGADDQKWELLDAPSHYTS